MLQEEQINKLTKLKELLDAGILNEEEFAQEKNRIMTQPQPQSAPQPAMESVMQESNPKMEDKPSTGLNILSFLLPIVGIIYYFASKDNYPIKAKSSLKWGIIGIVCFAIYHIIIAIAQLGYLF